MIKFDIFKWLSDKAGEQAVKSEKKYYSKSIEYENNLSNMEKCLDVPVIGGYIYVYKKYRQAVHTNKKLESKRRKKRKIIDVIKEKQSVVNSINTVIDDLMGTGRIKNVMIKNQYLTEFLMCCEERKVIAQEVIERSNDKERCFLLIISDIC